MEIDKMEYMLALQENTSCAPLVEVYRDFAQYDLRGGINININCEGV